MTTEALLHVLIDRTKILDAKHPSLLNAAAISHMKAALSSLEQRTADRITFDEFVNFLVTRLISTPRQ